MIKAFLKKDVLVALYQRLECCHNTLERVKHEQELTYKDKLVYEVTCFALPMMDDYMSDNLYSMVNYVRFRSIIEACTLLSLNEERDFHRINSNLLEPQFNILKYRIYKDFAPNYVNTDRLKKDYEIGKELTDFSRERDGSNSSKIHLDTIVDQRLPILLGRDELDSIRYYLGYIYENIYIKSGEMIHLIDYRDLENKYSLTFFNDISRMLVGMLNQYDLNYDKDTKKKRIKDAGQIKKVFLDESFVLQSVISKIESKYDKCFISQAIYEMTKLEKSLSNSLVNGRYYDINTIYKVIIEWIVNVNSLTDSIQHLQKFNFDTEIEKLGKEQREFKFASMKRNLITPNITWQRESLTQIVNEFVDSTKKNVKKYYGLSNREFLKMKYCEAKITTHGNGFLALADDKYFELDKELLLSINDLFKETVDKVTGTLGPELDLMVESQITKRALDHKYTLFMKL